jgi:hypothetical protein
MGTRALIHVKDDEETLVTIYRQYDGYPSGLGQDIKDVFEGRELVNGYNDLATQVNGMGCAAAMLVAGIKKGCGIVYIYPVDSSDCGEEYTYVLYAKEGKLMINDGKYDGLLERYPAED